MTTSNNQTGRLSPQSMLQGRYIIAGQVGRGGMGAVYAASDTRIGQRRVAIKEMSQANLDEAGLRAATERFQLEARMLASMQHPNLPHIYDAFSENGRSYLVMDFIDGKTLQQVLREQPGKPLQVAQVLLYARQLCDVLAYLHQQNPPIIFRDVKPTNIMVNEKGQVFLIDFGIARFFKEGQEQDTILLGSPGYAPPEQHGIAQTNPRSDLYGLGATLHYCLTGRDPYYSPHHFDFPSIQQYNPQVPPELDRLIQSMVAQDEKQRPASALEVQKALIAISQQASDFTSALSPATAATQYIPSGTPASPPATREATPVVNSVPTVAVPPRAGGQQTAPAFPLPPTARPHPASVWTRGFITLFGLFFVLTVGSSLFTFATVCNSDHMTEAGIAILSGLVALGALAAVRSTIPRSILLIAGLGALAAGIAFIIQTQPDTSYISFSPSGCPRFIQPAFFNFLGLNLNSSELNSLFTASLAVASIISLGWLLRPFTLADRGTLLVLFGIATICALVQFLFPDNIDTKHILLLVALITLLLGVLVAARTERVRINK